MFFKQYCLSGSITGPTNAPSNHSVSNHHFLLFWTNSLERLFHKRLGLQHHIVNESPSMAARSRIVLIGKISATKAEFEHVWRLGIVCSTSSQWESPLHSVPNRKDESLCFGVYRAIIDTIVRDRNPFAHTQFFSNSLLIFRIFSTIGRI